MATPIIPGFPSPQIPGPMDPETLKGKFWQIIDELDAFSAKHGLPVPRMRPILEQYPLVNTDRIREVGQQVWGTGGTRAGIPATLYTELPDRVTEAVAKAGERWEGPAFEQFTHWMGNLKETLKQFPAPAQEVGQLLVELADRFELSWITIIGMVAEVAGLIMAAAGVVALGAPEPVVSKVVGTIEAVVGLILSLVGTALVLIEEVGFRMQAAKKAVDRLTHEIDKMIPVTPDAAIPVPTGDWQRRTPDPTN